MTDTPAWLDSARKIVREHQYQHVNPETGEIVPEGARGAVLFDASTASFMVQVHSALRDAAREKFEAMTFPQAHNITMKILEKQR